MPGVGSMINSNQIREVEARLKKNKAIICSMTKKERMDPDLLLTSPSARSRLQRISRGSGNNLEDGLKFMSEFQRMRTMMSRMQKQMGGMAMDPAAAGSPALGMGGEAMPAMGNRATRRAAKKVKKSSRGGGGGFG
jgi:signal recognition particle subunit SRP54